MNKESLNIISSIKKIDMISIQVPSNLIDKIPDIDMSYTIGRIGAVTSKAIILTFTNQTDRDNLYDLLIQSTDLHQ